MNSEELIQLLVRFSRSDDNFSDAEFVYVLHVAERLGIDRNKLEDLIRIPAGKSVSVPSSEHERMRIFYYLLFLMKIDKHINPQEIELVHHFGFKLGFSRAMINDFIDLISEYTEERVPASEMLDIIRKYQN